MFCICDFIEDHQMMMLPEQQQQDELSSAVTSGTAETSSHPSGQKQHQGLSADEPDVSPEFHPSSATDVPGQLPSPAGIIHKLYIYIS